MDYSLRFWAEYITPVRIAEQALDLLVEFSAGVGVAVNADSLTEENAAALAEIKKAGIELAFWPLLSEEEGYFPYEGNVPAYTGFVRDLLEWAEVNGVRPDIIAVDLEMPFHQMMSVLEAEPSDRLGAVARVARENLDRDRYRKAKSELAEFNKWIQGEGMRTLTAVLPWVALEIGGDWEILQDLTETPIKGIDWDIVSPMWYVSMLEGLSGGVVSRRDANWLLFEASLWLRNTYGKRAGVSLGVTGTGVLGNEPTFDSVEELMTGVQAALAAGIRDISVYNLEGVISRDKPRDWFESLASARPEVPPRSRRAALALAGARFLYPHLAGLIDRVS